MSADTQKELIAWANAELGGERGAQAKLARRLDLSQDKISRSLKGEREFSFGEVIEMAKMFGKPPPGLEAFLGDGPHVPPQVESRLEEIERKIDALARHLGVGVDAGRRVAAARAVARRISEVGDDEEPPESPAPDAAPQ